MFATFMTIVWLTVGLAALDDKTVAGAWNMSLQGDHVIPVGMELKQDGAKVTGIILMPTHRIGERKEVSLADLQVLAFASEITRVVSFKLGRDHSNRVYPDSGFTGAVSPHVPSQRA